jgi:6-pyruvoyltetrahydropterin/6-carboxytetrahydropterin synthase
MYTVCVRDHMMIAHSFSGEAFGPAQRLHGATYVVDVEFRRRELDDNGMVVDIGLAGSVLHEILAAMNYRNLDAEPEFSGSNTTTEFLARTVFERLAQALRAGRLGPSATAVTALRVTLHESHVAWASYEAELAVR